MNVISKINASSCSDLSCSTVVQKMRNLPTVIKANKKAIAKLALYILLGYIVSSFAAAIVISYNDVLHYINSHDQDLQEKVTLKNVFYRVKSLFTRIKGIKRMLKWPWTLLVWIFKQIKTGANWI